MRGKMDPPSVASMRHSRSDNRLPSGRRGRQGAHRLVAAAIIVWTLLVSRSAGADEELLSWVDRDAAVVVRLDAATLEGLVDLAGSVDGQGNRWRVLVIAGGSALLGFNVLSTQGWDQAGLATGSPVLVQVTAIDRARAALSTASTSDPPFWRSRVVMRAADSDALEKTLLAIPAVSSRLPLKGGDEQSIASVVGAGPKSARSVVRDLRRAGVFAVGTAPHLGATVFFHRHGNVIVVDILSPFGRDQIRWQPQRASVLRLLARRGDMKSAPGASTADLGRSGLALWSQPQPLVAVIEAQELEAAGPNSSAHLYSRCRPLRDVAAGAPFEAFSVSLGIDKHAVSARATLTLAEGEPLQQHLEVAPAPVLNSQAGEGLIGASLYLRQIASLRKLKRPMLLKQSWEAPFRSARECGTPAQVALLIFTWPQLIGLFADELAAVSPNIEAVVSSVGALGVVVRRVGKSRQSWSGVVEAAVQAPAANIVAGWHDLVFGFRRQSAQRIRWGRGPMRPYQLGTKSPGQVIVGYGYGADADEWALARAARVNREVLATTGDARRLGDARANLHEIARQMGDSAPPPLRLLGAVFGDATATAQLAGDAIQLRVSAVRK